MTNSGTLTGSSSSSARVLEGLSSVSGNIAITNTASGSISTSSKGYAIYADTLGAGTLSLNNAGLLSATGGINATAVYYQNLDGDITASNTGTITSTHDGLDLDNRGSGNISATNSGSISGSEEALIATSDSGNVYVSNSGTLTSASEAVEAETSTGTDT